MEIGSKCLCQSSSWINILQFINRYTCLNAYVYLLCFQGNGECVQKPQLPDGSGPTISALLLVLDAVWRPDGLCLQHQPGAVGHAARVHQQGSPRNILFWLWGKAVTRIQNKTIQPYTKVELTILHFCFAGSICHSLTHPRKTDWGKIQVIGSSRISRFLIEYFNEIYQSNLLYLFSS